MRTAVSLLVALLLALLAGGYWYWSSENGEDDQSYVTETVARGPVTATVIATGVVNPVTTVQVGTYVSGPIIALDVDFNSPVRKGQRVAKIDPAPFQVKVQSAEANLANARAKVAKSEADLALKRLTYERNRELRGRDLIAQNALDTAKSDYDQAVAQLALDQAGVKQAEASLQEARINLNYTDIVSPVDGVVVSRSVDVGQTVAASFQTPTLFQIAQDLTRMQVNASVSESDIGSVDERQKAIFTVDAFPGRQFEGAVVQVRNAPVTVQNVVTYDVVVAVANPDLALKPGMTATVTITTGHRDDVLRAPLRALSFNPPAADGAGNRTPRRDDTQAVWRLAPNGSLQRVPVQTGLRDEQFVEIETSELAPGDEIAIALRKAPDKPQQMQIPGRPRFR
jgi:HlyD family secretion protein